LIISPVTSTFFLTAGIRRITSKEYREDWARKNVEVTGENDQVEYYKVYYQLVASKTQISLLDAK